MWQTVVWRQFGAAIDMIDDALRDCPDELWAEDMWEDPKTPGFSAFWYVAFHALFWIDYYLSCSPEGFAPPAPFGMEELDPAGRLPARAYTRAELQSYLGYGRRKCREAVTALADEDFGRPCRVRRNELTFAELVLYTMRHTQEHAAQLGMFLGQRTGSAAGWVGFTRDS